jgi:UDP-N-acetylglucosamine--N-acetylmuramyl-(pentapeptide) pyrophosphoryl-undecaprenol N-acetylglucosamine transferase
LADIGDSRIYFSPCGIGLGHVGRSLTVAEELRGRGAEVLFSTYLEAVDFVNRRGFPVVSAPAFNLSSDSTGRLDLRATAIKNGVPALKRFMQQVTAEIEYMKAFEPDVVVSDTRLSSVIAGKLLGLPVALILNQFQPMIPRKKQALLLSRIVDGGIMTVLGKGWAASDVILVPDFPEPYTICIDSLRIPPPYREIVRMVGYILDRRPEDVEDTGRVREEAGASEGQRLIYAAISGPDRERIPLIGILKPIFEGFPDDFRVVMSLGDPNGGSGPESSGALTTIPWVRDRFEYLKACDLVVCRGGHNTIMQSICYGKPPIVVPTPDHTEQFANARRAMEIGVAEVAQQEGLSRETLLEKARGVVSCPGYGERLREINSKGFTGGLGNVVSYIADLVSSK